MMTSCFGWKPTRPARVSCACLSEPQHLTQNTRLTLQLRSTATYLFDEGSHGSFVVSCLNGGGRNGFYFSLNRKASVITHAALSSGKATVAFNDAIHTQVSTQGRAFRRPDSHQSFTLTVRGTHLPRAVASCWKSHLQSPRWRRCHYSLPCVTRICVPCRLLDRRGLWVIRQTIAISACRKTARAVMTLETR